MRETEASLLAQGTEERDITLMEKLLMAPGLSRKDVTTLILDMLFAGIDTVRLNHLTLLLILENESKINNSTKLVLKIKLL